MQEEKEEEEMKYKDVKMKEEHGSMEAGGSTLPNWGIHRNLISALCVQTSQLTPHSSTG